MIFSKSFGYALRSVLYIALTAEEGKRVQIDEIAKKLNVPRYFLGKVMNKIVKEKILDSAKGPYGGFQLNDKTLATPLLRLIHITEGTDQFKNCVLSFRKCNAKRPCPLHHQLEAYKNQLLQLFSETTIGDVLKKNDPNFINSIAIS